MNLTVDLETCTILVRIKHPAHLCYAVFVSRLTGEAWRLKIEELIAAFELAAKRKRRHRP
jgi:hypothetical protein